MSQAGWIVRDARETDAAMIGTLVAAVYVGEGWSPESAWLRLGDGNWVMGQGTVLVAAGQSVLGSVLMALPGQPGRQIGRDDEVEVRLLAVSPDARGSGIGEALMREILRRAATLGFEAVVLSTQTRMLAAQRLYDRLGFERQPERDWQRDSGAPMLVFRIAIST